MFYIFFENKIFSSCIFHFLKFFYFVKYGVRTPSLTASPLADPWLVLPLPARCVGPKGHGAEGGGLWCPYHDEKRPRRGTAEDTIHYRTSPHGRIGCGQGAAGAQRSDHQMAGPRENLPTRPSRRKLWIKIRGEFVFKNGEVLVLKKVRFRVVCDSIKTSDTKRQLGSAILCFWFLSAILNWSGQW